MWQSPTTVRNFNQRELTGLDAWAYLFSQAWERLEVDPEDLGLYGLYAFARAVAEKHGDEDPAEYVWQLSADHLIHSWDLAAATGQDRTLDAELVAAVAGWFAEREELYRGAGMVAPRLDTTSDDAQTQLLAAGGRDAGWTPPRP